MKQAILAGLLCIFLPLNANSQELPDVNWLISEVVKKAIENDEVKKRHLQFFKEEIVSDLNNIGFDGKPERKKYKADRRGVGLKNDDPKLKPEDISTTYHEFRYSVPYIQTSKEGTRYYEVSFKPKRENQDGINPYVKGANRASGTMYIDAEHLYVFRLEAEMPKDAGFTVGLVFGSIQWFDAIIKQERRTDLKNLVVITSVVIRVRYRFIIPRFFEQYEFLYSDYVYKN